MMQQPINITDEQVIEQAIAYVHWFGWTVTPADCSVQRAVTEEMRHSGRPDAWMVFMLAQPAHNATLRTPMPLGCRVQLLEGRLCAVSVYEPPNRRTYLV